MKKYLSTVAPLALAAIIGGTQAARADDLRIGNHNRITQTADMRGNQTAFALGPFATAQNGNGSMMSAGGLGIGNHNTIDQHATMRGNQTAFALGPFATAQNGNGSIMSGGR